MFHALKTRDFKTFDRLAHHYDVRYIVAPGSGLDSLDSEENDGAWRFDASGLPADGFRQVFQAKDLSIIEVRPHS
jgi:hypothetical protein